MPNYDFTNPQDEQAFRQAASAKGASAQATNDYIARRRGEQLESIRGTADIYKSQASILQSQKDIGELTGGKQDEDKMATISLVDEVFVQIHFQGLILLSLNHLLVDQ